MREERGMLQGDQVISDAVDLWGTVMGKVTVVSGGKVYVRGSIIGDLVVQDGGRVHVYGNVTGEVQVLEGAKVILSGAVNDATNLGGRLYIESTAKILRRLRARDGETLIDPKAQINA